MLIFSKSGSMAAPCAVEPSVPQAFTSNNGFHRVSIALMFGILSLCLTVPASAQSGSNLLTNPGFESGSATPFTGAQKGLLSVQSAKTGSMEPHSGQYYLMIRATANDAYTIPYHSNATAAVAAAAPGETFTLSAFARASQNGMPMSMRIFSLDANYKVLDQTLLMQNAGLSWQKFIVMHTCPANTAYVSIRLDNDGFNAAGGEVDMAWDDLKLVRTANYDAALVSQNIPTSLEAGETAQASITLQNIGLNTWSADENYRLGSQNPANNSTWGLGRVLLDGKEFIAPGQQKTFTFNITAPSTTGNYNFQWRMLREAVVWFGDITPNIAISVDTVSDPMAINFTAPTTQIVLPTEYYDMGSVVANGSTSNFNFALPKGSENVQLTGVSGPVTVNLTTGGAVIGASKPSPYTGSIMVNDYFQEDDLKLLLACSEGIGNTTSDNSGNGHDGTLVGASWATGPTGPVLEFDGVDDYVDLGSPAGLNMSNEITLSAWIYPTGSQIGYIISKDGSYNLAMGNFGTVTAQFNTADGWSANILSADNPLTLNEWSQVIVTYSATTGEAVLYLNGVRQDTATKTGNISSNSEAITIGVRDNVSLHQPFQGQIAEVEILSRALSEEEAAARVDGGYPFEADLEFTYNNETYPFSVIGVAQVLQPQNWSDPTTWGGTLPGPNTSVTIASDQIIHIDTDVNVKNITVHGQLIALNSRNHNISTNWMMVENGGLFQLGTESNPYQNQAVITLKHDLNDTIANVGTKFIAARSNGQVEIHGEEKLSWTQLNANANRGSTQITLKESVNQAAGNWKVNDQIVIASTDFNPHQAEVRTIDSISGDGRTLTLDTALNYNHHGSLQTYNNGTRSFTLDERAEVGLLTRNILIQGDSQSENNGFGGHTMFMPTSTVHFSGVELYRMGQEGELARYPFHWHFARNVSGQYIKNSSVHRSFNRVVTVHSTDNALVEGVVGYDHIGHGFFLEDGSEVGNTFRNNLGILTKKPDPNRKVAPHDLVISTQRGRVMLPATFWMTNPDNSWIGNAAAGSEGSGYWMVVLSRPIDPAQPINPSPGSRPIRAFNDNRAHSNDFSNFSIDGSVNPTTQALDEQGQLPYGHYAPSVNGVQSIPRIYRFTGFKTRERNVWTRAHTMEFIDCALADSPRNTFFAHNQFLIDSLIVGKSNNIGTPFFFSNHENTAGRSLARPGWPATNDWNVFSGHTIYDGPSELVDVHMANFADFNTSDGKVDTAAFNTNAAAVKSTVHQVTGITFQNVPEANKVWFGKASNAETMYSSGIIDNDGSIVGDGNRVQILPQINPHPSDTKIRESGFNHEPGAQHRPDWDAYLNDQEHFGLVYTEHGWDFGEATATYNIRINGTSTYATYGKQLSDWSNMNPVIVNDNYQYHWQYHRIANKIMPQLRFVNQNDYMISVFPNMPSDTRVYDNTTGNTPLTRVNSLGSLFGSNQQRYYFDDNTIYIRHVANEINPYYLAQNGQDYKYLSRPLRLCLYNNCGNEAGFSDKATFADLEMGLDGRASTNRSGNLTLPTITTSVSNPNTAPFDSMDDYISWTVVSDGDGNDEYVELRFDFPRQVWTDFQYLTLNLLGGPFELLVQDQNNGQRSFGTHQPSSQVVIDLNPNANRNYLDNVIALIIRTHESDLGSLNASLQANMKLYEIALSIDEPNSTIPDPPNNVMASDGTHSDRVRITWNTVGGVSGYEVWRSDQNNSVTANLLDTTTASTYDDETVVLDQTYYYWVKSVSGSFVSEFSLSDDGFSHYEPPTGNCSSDNETMCLRDGRFQVQVEWEDFNGNTGTGKVANFGNNESGLFWFFNPSNLEFMVKVLDGCAVNGRFWVFASATTNVGYTLTVTDTVTGAIKVYTNPVGNLAPAITDTDAFVHDSPPPNCPPPIAEGEYGTPFNWTSGASCVPGPQRHCFRQGRFEVVVQWRDFNNNTGAGSVVPFGTDESGLFWFFNSSNWEFLVKVLDGCGLNNRFWVFAAATTNVEYDLTVTDTLTGQSKTYHNPLGVSADAIGDTDAFDTCP